MDSMDHENGQQAQAVLMPKELTVALNHQQQDG